MKLPLSWLREWVDLPDDAPAIAAQLTSLGFEVEALERVAPPFSGVIVAEIQAIAPHPQADKLRVCTVNAGAGIAPLQIVCGAPNARAGLKTALAQLGAVLPGDLRIKAAKLRGVESSGMLCSAKELGIVGGIEGILELPADAPVGSPLRDYLDLDDWTLELGITPNRGDAMSVLGIARELAAARGVSLKTPVRGAVGAAPVSGAEQGRVRIEPESGCARFASRIVRGVRSGVASPAWLQQRLQRAGLRSISPVVDVTNYIVLELGQPMHAYDLAQLQGTIVARRARAGESITLLDGRSLALSGDELAIADDRSVVGLAGIMGGERTGIADSTRDLFLEVAWFEPAAIAGRARRYGLLTDASQRFERGVDPALQEQALERATQLILELVGGEAGPIDLQQVVARVPVRKAVKLRTKRLAAVLGRAVPANEVTARLRALGMRVDADGTAGESLAVTPPSWRFDIHIEADLIEEIARTVGLDQIPELPAQGQRRLRLTPESRIDERAVLQLLAARGYHEIVTFGFTDPALQQRLFGPQPAVTLRNPIASDLAVMRISLWPGLLQAALQNLRRQQERCKLVEVASVFRADGDGRVHEVPTIAGLAAGPRLPEQWGAGRDTLDFHDLKGDLQALLAIAGQGGVVSFEPLDAPPPALHPGRCAAVLRDGARIGVLGALHPAVAHALEVGPELQLFELELALVTTAAPTRYEPVSVFPRIRRDLSFTVDAGEPFSRIAEHVSVAASSRLKELRIFDVYTGKGVESGRKSVALGLILQDISRTLTDAEADETVAAVIAELRSGLNARIRE
jgi:phenylalanyl-tRNA synthetase beta chain